MAEKYPDEGLGSEGQYIVDTIEKWIAKAREIEDAAYEAKDLYTAYIVADALYDILKGCDESKEAKGRSQIYKDDDLLKVGKDFHKSWEKCWGKDKSIRIKFLKDFQSDNPDTYYAALCEEWLK